MLLPLTAFACTTAEAAPQSGASAHADETRQLYLDVHELGPGKVSAEAVAEAHVKDLAVQHQHDVSFLRYWVDEEHGKVYCLSRAPSSHAVIETHRQAHGLLPNTVSPVVQGE